MERRFKYVLSPSVCLFTLCVVLQFARRYLECQASMPVSVLRSYINRVLPHSSTTQVSIFDSNDRLLNDSDRLSSLKGICSSKPTPVRFTLMNMVTSLGHCSCCSPSFSNDDRSSCSPTIIRRETLDVTLSTCPFVSTPPLSPCRSTSPPDICRSSMSIVNLLSPPSPPPIYPASFLLDTNPDELMINQITSEFGEICPPLARSKPKRPRLLKKFIPKVFAIDGPLDLSLKTKRPTFDLFVSEAKWLKT